MLVGGLCRSGTGVFVSFVKLQDDCFPNHKHVQRSASDSQERRSCDETCKQLAFATN